MIPGSLISCANRLDTLDIRHPLFPMNTHIVDSTERDNSIVYHFFVNGLNKEDVKIELNDNELYVHGKCTVKSENSEKFCSYSKRINIRNNLDKNNVNATYENGVVHIELMKLSPQNRQITIS